MIGIIDYGLGNLGSIQNMLKVIGEKSVITNDKRILDGCDKLILPGVGAYDAGVENIERFDLKEYIRSCALADKKPILGICLGMQLLGQGSEEGGLNGLDLIPFRCRRFNFTEDNLKVPHMGWDVVSIEKKIPLTEGLDIEKQRYYFVHSYYACCEEASDVAMTCDYGVEFVASVARGNVMGVQFHPEKSHTFGMRLLTNFVRGY